VLPQAARVISEAARAASRGAVPLKDASSFVLRAGSQKCIQTV
jgi:hypothetical protein